jgi:pyruvate kinase
VDRLTAPDDLVTAPPCAALEALHEEVVRDGDALFDRWRPRIARPSFAVSALNLARYIALRRRDLRDLQVTLMPWGLSSLGRCEARVIENLEAVLDAARALASTDGLRSAAPSAEAYFRGHELLRAHTAEALGPAPSRRTVRIMVTLPTDAATDHALVRGLVERGMDIARINCGHDDADVWTAMCRHVRRAASELGRSTRICMDLCGPRCRTSDVWTDAERRRLCVGDRLRMTAQPAAAHADVEAGFTCSIPDAVAQVRVGDAVLIDEGKLATTVVATDAGSALLRVTRARARGERLKPDKGLNFPDRGLLLRPLTGKDLADLDVAAQLADMIGYSFVQRADDVGLLQAELAARVERLEQVALVAKIETALAVRNLPEIIVQGAGSQPMAVMIARGDLAVEVGPRRLAELQEEILWLCEAAHVPVVWATQVLDTLVHEGVEHRAEITDAAMAERAECVMLNKGPHVGEAITLLDEMLTDMQDHQFKKASRLRALRSW